MSPRPPPDHLDVTASPELGVGLLIRRLVCRNVRGLEDIAWDPGPGPQLLLGGTGQGKTSLLESLYIACTTRSFRTARLGDCVAFEAAKRGLGLFTSVEVETGSRARLEVSWSAADGLARSVNGDRSPLADHVGRQPILAWSAADNEVLTGAPESRRRLIDRVGVSVRPRALDQLGAYRRTLEHKRALLQQRADLDSLRSFQTLLVRAAEDLIAMRRRTVEQLQTALRSVLEEVEGPRLDLDLRYRSSPHREAAESSSHGWSESDFDQRLEGERAIQRPLLGPHRDRIDVLFRDRPIAETASAGERKAIGLILLAAQSRVLSAAGRTPVLLIDDVDTEMDQQTLERVWPLLGGSPQTLVSSNRESVFDNLSVPRVWHVRDGAISNL